MPKPLYTEDADRMIRALIEEVLNREMTEEEFNLVETRIYEFFAPYVVDDYRNYN